MLPRIILHNTVSVDGRMDLDWSIADIGLYYELASRWNADAILSGSNTILTAPDQAAGEADETIGPQNDPTDLRPLFVVVDSRGQIHNWNFLRKQPYWRDVIVLCSRSTPGAYLDELHKKEVGYIMAGDDRVDLRAALEQLNAHYRAKTIRVDSGGTLNGILLRAGLVDEVSVLIHPALVGGTSSRSIFVAPDLTSAAGAIRLKLNHIEKMRGDAVWLHYEVIK